MIKHIIFFIGEPFNERDVERFGIAILQKNGFSIELWDFTRLLHPHLYAATKDNPLAHRVSQHVFQDIKAAVKAINSLGLSACVISLIGYGYRSLPIYTALSKKNIFYAVTQLANLPPMQSGSNF